MQNLYVHVDMHLVCTLYTRALAEACTCTDIDAHASVCIVYSQGF